MTNQMPREEGLDHSLNVLLEGYMYILNRRTSFHSDVFETRLLGQKAICMGGSEAADIFYDNNKFIRTGAAPNRVVQTLFGEKGVQTLDGEKHRQRKEMFMKLMSPGNLEHLKEITRKHWDMAISRWEELDKVVLHEEVKELLFRVACEWAGVPIQEDEVKERTSEIAGMFEGAGALGPSHWRGRNGRNQTKKWLIGLINKVRNKELYPPENTALYNFSWHHDVSGNMLDPEVAAVEVINIIRPIVAISIYVNFSFLALHHYPEEKAKLGADDSKAYEMFVQEVRRFYPFFPFLVAKVKEDFTWREFNFEEGTLTLLDIYGTNHDPKIWDNPDLFIPERFANWQESPFAFIPQGGGDYSMGHRCAGEWVTIEVMKISLDMLVNNMKFDIPDQDLSFSMVKIPSIPHSGIIINNVKRE